MQMRMPLMQGGYGVATLQASAFLAELGSYRHYPYHGSERIGSCIQRQYGEVHPGKGKSGTRLRS
jgi:hypothetical protein